MVRRNFLRLCVIIINQVSRGTAGQENSVRRARSEEPERRAKSEECRGQGGGLAAVVLHSTHYDFVTNICFVILL